MRCWAVRLSTQNAPPGDRRPRLYRVLRQCLLQSPWGLPPGLLPLTAPTHVPTMMRREWLTALVTQVHADARGTYVSRRVRAELI